ncbi:porin family protein [Pseudochrobactrum sp. sp1633]|uniref:outer membrane protein n=1 Tax=Pseudochrobactrum sp. sp1633 TaxID=3036706 RepID=UPI0025A66150|nr:outer membrane protein [Pseudochrobactrum sp. sp1633]MDM8345390.1 porin family protein [Pseudochrobactrum sp. sp1633]HWD13017.1 outer membrane protein [Pseudochrobactrum sp.]
MKSILLATALVMTAGTAFAADAVVYNEPAPAVVDTFSWTGGYIGLNAGYAGGKFKTDFYEDVFTDLSLRGNASGFIGGVQAGYNWQFDQAIVGIETDFQGSSLKSDFSVSDSMTGISLGTKVSWFGTTRLRLGYTPVDRFMVYATGGVAYGKVKTYADVFGGYSSQSDTKVGYTVGAGAEYAITNNVTLKTEYLYTDLGKLKLDADFDGRSIRIGEAKSQFHTVRVGVNYKF